MIPFFLRSLASTMSRRFPINAAGDPHAAPNAHLFVHSVVSLLTLPASAAPPPPAPLEHLNLRSSYLSYLQATHITPLQVLQALLPLLRASPARARDALANGAGASNGVGAGAGAARSWLCHKCYAETRKTNYPVIIGIGAS